MLLLGAGDASLTAVRLRRGGNSDGDDTADVTTELWAAHGATAVGAALRAAAERNAAPALGDLDGDGNTDLLVGLASGQLLAFRNVATDAAPAYVAWDDTYQVDGLTHGLVDARLGALWPPLRGLSQPVAAAEARPVLVDIDSDGDLDAFVGCAGCGDGARALLLLRNDGSAQRPAFVLHEPLDAHPLAVAAQLVGLRNHTLLQYNATLYAAAEAEARLAFDGGPYGYTGDLIVEGMTVSAAGPVYDASERASDGGSGGSDGDGDGDGVALSRPSPSLRGSLAFGFVDSDAHLDAVLAGVAFFGDGAGSFARPATAQQTAREEPLLPLLLASDLTSVATHDAAASDDVSAAGATTTAYGLVEAAVAAAHVHVEQLSASVRDSLQQILLLDVDGDGDEDALLFEGGGGGTVGAETAGVAMARGEVGELGTDGEATAGAALGDAGEASDDGSVAGVGRGGAVHVALSRAKEARGTFFKCKWAGTFEPRPCWSCPDYDGIAISDSAAIAAANPTASDAHGLAPSLQTPPPPFQMEASWEASRPSEVRCEPPPIVLAGLGHGGADGTEGRVFSGPYRVELSFNDQQWTQEQLTYEYVPPWETRGGGLYPSSGPLLGGTLVQVLGVGTAAAATGDANAIAWRAAFFSHDANQDLAIDAAELPGLVASLVARRALPEAMLTKGALAAAMAPYDEDADGAYSHDEFMDARPRGVAADGTADGAALATACLFGPVAADGIAGWTATAMAGGVGVRTANDGEWMACRAPAAAAAQADVSVLLTFDEVDAAAAPEPTQVLETFGSREVERDEKWAERWLEGWDSATAKHGGLDEEKTKEEMLRSQRLGDTSARQTETYTLEQDWYGEQAIKRAAAEAASVVEWADRWEAETTQMLGEFRDEYYRRAYVQARANADGDDDKSAAAGAAGAKKRQQDRRVESASAVKIRQEMAAAAATEAAEEAATASAATEGEGGAARASSMSGRRLDQDAQHVRNVKSMQALGEETAAQLHREHGQHHDTAEELYHQDGAAGGGLYTTIDPATRRPSVVPTDGATWGFGLVDTMEAQHGVACDACGTSAGYLELISNDGGRDKRTVYASGCPNHYSYCTGKPGVAGCGGVGEEGSATEATLQAATFELPARPVLIVAPSEYTNLLCNRGAIGVALNGASILSGALDPSCAQLSVPSDAATAAWQTIDFCGGSLGISGEYGYRVAPSCLVAQARQAGHAAADGHSPQVGWALDGFPVYGPHGPGGREMVHAAQGCVGSICLDECSGMPGELPGVDGFKYRYYLAGALSDGHSLPVSPRPGARDAPFTMHCHRGCTWHELRLRLPKCSGGLGVVDGYVPQAHAGLGGAVYTSGAAVEKQRRCSEYYGLFEPANVSAPWSREWGGDANADGERGSAGDSARGGEGAGVTSMGWEGWFEASADRARAAARGSWDEAGVYRPDYSPAAATDGGGLDDVEFEGPGWWGAGAWGWDEGGGDAATSMAGTRKSRGASAEHNTAASVGVVTRSDIAAASAATTVREWIVSSLPTSQGVDRPAALEVTGTRMTRMRRGVLQLTDSAPHTGGAAIFALPPPHGAAPPSRTFAVSLSLLAAGGSGGDGFSLSYGELPNDYLDEFGGGDGLRLQLRTGVAQQAALVYNRTVLRARHLPAGALRGRWLRVAVRHDEETGFSAWLGREALFQGVPLPGFSPTRSWRFGLGAKCGLMDDKHWVDQLRLSRGASLGVGFAPVQLSVNGRDFTDGGAASPQFSYYPPPIISSLSPASGPLAGATRVLMRGHGLRRAVEASAASSITVDPSSSSSSSTTTAISGCDPAAFGGACDSGYKCKWGGCTCDDAVDCACPNVTVARWDAAADGLVCDTPDWSGTSIIGLALPRGDKVDVALNGQDFTPAGDFTFTRHPPVPLGFDLLQLSPRAGPTRGGTVVELRAPGGVAGGTEYVCRFGPQAAARAPASRDGGDAAAATTLRCAAPAASTAMSGGSGAGRVPLWLSLNGQQFSPLGLPGEAYEYVAPAVLSSVSPSAGPADGATRLVLSGVWAATAQPLEKLSCRFGELTVRASRGEGGTLVCLAPEAPMSQRSVRRLDATQLRTNLTEYASWWSTLPSTGVGYFAQDAGVALEPPSDDGQQVSLEVSLNGQDYSASGVAWTWLPPPQIDGSMPLSGPAAGGTLVELRGDGFASAPHPQCRFGATVVEAVVAEAEWVTAEAPLSERDWGEAGARQRRLLTLRCDPTPPAVVNGGGAADAGTGGRSGTVKLEVTLNGQDFVDAGLTFTYYEPPPLLGLSPALGPVAGNTLVQLQGEAPLHNGSLYPAWSAEYICRFGRRHTFDANGTAVEAEAGQLVPGALGAAGHATAEGDALCTTPKVPAIGSTAVELSLNAQQYGAVALPFAYHAPIVTVGVAPRTGPVVGATDVLVRLGNVSLTAAALGALPLRCVCRFWQVEFGADVASRIQLPDEADFAAVAAAAANATASGGSSSAASADTDTGSWDGDAWDTASSAALAAALVAGGDAAEQLTLRCQVPRLGEVMNADGSDLPGGEVAPIAVSLNAQDFTAPGATFGLYAQPHVSSVYPTAGPLTGSTNITVRGDGLFGLGERLMCRFRLDGGERQAYRAFNNASHGEPAQQEYLEDEAERRALRLLSQQPLESTVRGADAAADAQVLATHLPVLVPATYEPSTGNLLCVSPDVRVGATRAAAGLIVDTAAASAAGVDSALQWRVEVSANGQQFSADEVRFGQYPHPIGSDLLPSGGPLAGGTAIEVTGSGLINGSEYLCRFGANRLEVPARMDFVADGGSGALHCQVPPRASCEPEGAAATGVSAVQISLNGQQWSDTQLGIDYFTPPAVRSFTPRAGPQAGGVAVRIYGDHFRTPLAVARHRQPPLVCNFDGVAVEGTLDTSGGGEPSVRCVAPERTVGAVPIELTFNGQDYTANGVTWLSYVVPSLSHVLPPAGPADGGTALVLFGRHLSLPAPHDASHGSYVCGFGDDGGGLPVVVVNATHAAAAGGHETLACVAPPLTSLGAASALPMTASLRVALHEPHVHQWSDAANAIGYGYYEPPLVTALSPRTGPVGGGTVVAVSGAHFGRYLNTTALPMPPLDAAETARLATAAAAGLPIDTELQRCVLGDAAEAAVVLVASNELVCTTPPVGQAGHVGAIALSFDDVAADTASLAGGELVLVGGAVAQAGVLRLGSSGGGGSGSGGGSAGAAPEAWGGMLLVYGLEAPHIDSFDVSFELALARPAAIGPRQVAGGVALSFGPLSPGDRVDELGVRVGMALRLNPTTGLALLWHGVVVASGPPPGSNSWVPVRVLANGTHVSVWQNGVRAIVDAPVDLRVNTTSSNATTAADGASLASVQSEDGSQPWRFALGGRSVRLDDDGYDFDFNGELYPSYVARLRIEAAGLLPSLTLPLRESPNGQQFTAAVPSGAGDANFTYLLPPVLKGISPASGAHFGGTRLLLSGANLHGGDDYRCRFHATAAVTATVAASYDAAASSGTNGGGGGGGVRCTTPLMPATTWANVSLTLNGQQFTDASMHLPFAVVGNRLGGSSDDYWTLGRFYARHVDACAATGVAADAVVAEDRVRGNGTCTSPGVEGIRVRPALGPSAGGTVVQLVGIAFEGGTDYRCRFSLDGSGANWSVTTARLELATDQRAHHHLTDAAGLPIEPWLLKDTNRTAPLQVLTCLAPPRDRMLPGSFLDGGLSLVQISINGQQYYGSNETFFRYHAPVQLSRIYVGTGHQAGGTRVNLTFANGTTPAVPDSEEPTVCRFGEQTVPATIDQDGAGEPALHCLTPPEPFFAAGSAGAPDVSHAGGHSLPDGMRLTGSARLAAYSSAAYGSYVGGGDSGASGTGSDADAHIGGSMLQLTSAAPYAAAH